MADPDFAAHRIFDQRSDREKIKNETVIGCIAAGTVLGSFIVSCMTLFKLLSLPGEERLAEVKIFTWITSGTFNADVAFLIDPLSCIMIMVVSGVGFLIHLYSIGYM